MSERLRVALDARSYDIIIGEGLIAQAGEHIRPLLRQPKLIIVTDSHVAPLHLPALKTSLDAAGIAHNTITVPAGEGSKSFETLAWLMDELMQLRPERGTTLLAFGGGVIGDLTGFAASVLLRGVDFIQFPTTLLAQVDSSVGGKTGINTAYGKNLVGSFHQPRLVLADISVLATLPKRQLLAGYSEIVKYGLINDPVFFAWLEQYGSEVASGNAQSQAYAVHQSCAAKAAIVGMDEKEQGARALLNLGHTFGHALEAETGFSDTLLHGEAVAIGMVMAFELSVRMGLCPAADLDRIRPHFREVGLPISPLDIRLEWSMPQLIRHFYHDKKVQDGALTFILARGIGQSFIEKNVSDETVRAMLAESLAL